MSEQDLNGRLTAVETRQADIREAIKTLDAKVDSINVELTKYKGFLGGITFLCSCVWAFIMMFADRLLK